MILQTYYRQNNYKPTDALKGSVSLLLQIPFFMAAYNFLSTLSELQGKDFGPIKDLGSPDGLLVIGGIAINKKRKIWKFIADFFQHVNTAARSEFEFDTPIPHPDGFFQFTQ